MSRVADYTIKGFLYQFNLTLLEILNSRDDETITVEGIIEDIDIKSQDIITAIQCKYHETKGKYTLSDIYKPILQMMEHYSRNQGENIRYVLHAYFSEEEPRIKLLNKNDIETMLNTDNKDFVVKYISKIIEAKDDEIKDIVNKSSKTTDDKNKIFDYYKVNLSTLTKKINLEAFLDRFEMRLGHSFEDICNKSKEKLKESDLSQQDIEDLFYPNSIQQIADLSILHNEEDRIVKKINFINSIKDKKKTAITRWTLELESYKSFMKRRRNQINCKLQNNNKIIYFILDADKIKGFEDDLINFIYDYNGKYNYKIKLHKTPMFCLDSLDQSSTDIHRLEERLYKKKISYENGRRGNTFFKDAFMRDAKLVPGKGQISDWREFEIRFTEYGDDVVSTINSNKPDILFIVGEKEYKDLDFQDVEVERITIRDFNELKYLLKLVESLD